MLGNMVMYCYRYTLYLLLSCMNLYFYILFNYSHEKENPAIFVVHYLLSRRSTCVIITGL